MASYYTPGAGGFPSSNSTGGPSGSSSSLAVVLGVVITMIALFGIVIQLFRGRNCFMRCQENAADATPAISMVQINGSSSNPGNNYVVPTNFTQSNLNTSPMVSSTASATDPNRNTTLVSPSGVSYLGQSSMASLNTTSSVVPTNANVVIPMSSFAVVNSANSNQNT